MPRIVSKKRTFFPDKNREQADIKKPQQYETDVQALRDKSEHLRGLRLARDAVNVTNASAERSDKC